MTAAGGELFVLAEISASGSFTTAVYRIDPSSSAPPVQVVLSSGSAAIGPDGSVYYENQRHDLVRLAPDGSSTAGPALGGQEILTVAGGRL
jgi:hypothetical protein